MKKNLVHTIDNFNLFSLNNKNIPTIILIHGFMGNINVWNNLYNSLYNKYKFILVDIPGHGNNIFYKNYNYTIDNIANDIIDNILNKNINNAIFVGHSMGGYISLSIAEKYPKLFSGLCLLHSTASSDNQEKKKVRINSIQLIKKNYSLFIEKSVKSWFNPKKIFLLEKEINFIKKIAKSTYLDCIIPLLISMAFRKNRQFLLKKTLFPKLYIVGKYDLILDKNKIYKEIKSGFKTNIIEIPTGHMGHIECPDLLLKIIKNFIHFIYRK
ncbi:alpha/beta fold hydrolase [Blattabacterium cuenoti]|uniref:alpha/beta fold hydrolase n=1 Tax=Blattabacterium cuenoti TaxID=1653831 RepID=UPI001EEC7702|nr:alpha/beta fold hydrolase [Blattabacterium cuenoti]